MLKKQLSIRVDSFSQLFIILFLSLHLSVFPTSIQAMECNSDQEGGRFKSMRRLKILTDHLFTLKTENAKMVAAAVVSPPPADRHSAQEILINWHKTFRIPSLKTAVLVVGRTGSGKSTAIAGLQGAPLIKTAEGITLNAPSSKAHRYPIIGLQPFDSETSYPALFSAKSGLVFVDTPGLKDTDGGDYEMVHSVTLECTIKSIQTHRVLVVLVHDDISPACKGNKFRELMFYFSPLFGPNVLKSVLWLVTRSSGREAEFLRNLHLFRKHIAEQKLEKGDELFEDTLRMLDSINEHNLVFFDPLLPGACKGVASRLKALSAVSLEAFHFNKQRHPVFAAFSEKVMQDGLKNHTEKVRLHNQWGALDAHISQLSHKDEDPLKRKLQKEIAENEEKRRVLIAEKTQVTMKLSHFNANDTKICLFDKRIEEKRWWGSPRRMFQSLKYTGQRITDYENPHDAHGNFRDWKLDKANGVFFTEYVGGFGRDAWAEVKLFGSSNDLPHIKSEILSLNKREAELTQAINEIDAEIGQLKQKAEKSGPTREQLEQQKIQLIREKATVKKALDSIQKAIASNADLYKAIGYGRRQLSFQNELDSSFQSFLRTL